MNATSLAHVRPLRRARHLLVLSGALLLGAGPAFAQTAPAATSAAPGSGGIPAYMDVIVGGTVPGPAQVARQNVLALNTGMFELYGDAGKLVQASILSQHPVILGLFSGAGGRFILYRPGQGPLEAPQVPEVYQLLKSVGHSVMALGVVVGPHMGKVDDTSWQPQVQAYKVRLQAALDSIERTSMPEAWRANNRALISENIAFIDKVTAAKVVRFEDVQAFAASQKDRLKLIIRWAADTQVKHWMGVLADWKQQLGPDWAKVYAASNTIYVARPEQRALQRAGSVLRARRHSIHGSFSSRPCPSPPRRRICWNR